ncbi:ABC transporter permease [Propionimicrobium sp. PCR01-08-3]|uniref:ABC transporter permease n=1 Tax=Propionimicrobium sp. PCR01-08-3 TaxID=3052086 RepID=UPI00255CC968|nr:ABC transporter permease [Propionimicrobium sp. PCR01-08-3]WIY81880.1 ABC transporter permease [Propionimicrobium sp. PCR01-08-3]
MTDTLAESDARAENRRKPDDHGRGKDVFAKIKTAQSTGPILALIIAVIIFSLSTDTFLNAPNLSLILQQTVVVGMLAIGQTLVILTSGIDLANAASMVLGMVLAAKVAQDHGGALGLIVALVVCVGIGLISGTLASKLRLPAFIATLGMFTILTATSRLITNSQSVPVADPVLRLLSTGTTIGDFKITLGTALWIVMIAVMIYALNRTAWGRHVYAVGDSPIAARANGVQVNRVLLSVYAVAGLTYAIAGWQSFGRVSVADPSAYQNGNMDAITAVVIGGTSMFGGRGGVFGSMIGAIIVVVLKNGLTQAGIDSLYQEIATGILVIVAVLVDRFSRKADA